MGRCLQVTPITASNRTGRPFIVHVYNAKVSPKILPETEICIVVGRGRVMLRIKVVENVALSAVSLAVGYHGRPVKQIVY